MYWIIIFGITAALPCREIPLPGTRQATLYGHSLLSLLIHIHMDILSILIVPLEVTRHQFTIPTLPFSVAHSAHIINTSNHIIPAFSNLITPEAMLFLHSLINQAVIVRLIVHMFFLPFHNTIQFFKDIFLPAVLVYSHPIWEVWEVLAVLPLLFLDFRFIDDKLMIIVLS